MPKTFLAFAFAFTIALAPSMASAELYKYQTKEGEIVLTSEPRDDLELIEIIGQKTKATTQTKTKTPKKRKAKRQDYDPIIREAANTYDLPFEFVKAVIKIESNFNPNAVSRVGAMGLMQLMPGTAEDMGVEDAFDPRQNIFGGTKYLRLLANKYDGDINLVLAGYNAGPGNVDKYDGIPFESTQGYVKNVYQWYQTYLEEEPPNEPEL